MNLNDNIIYMNDLFPKLKKIRYNKTTCCDNKKFMKSVLKNIFRKLGVTCELEDSYDMYEYLKTVIRSNEALTDEIKNSLINLL